MVDDNRILSGEGFYECLQLFNALGLQAPSSCLRDRGHDLLLVLQGKTDVKLKHVIVLSIDMLNFALGTNDILLMSFCDFVKYCK